jgi:hypothetical protein
MLTRSIPVIVMPRHAGLVDRELLEVWTAVAV